MALQLCRFRVEGVTSLLMNSPEGMARTAGAGVNVRSVPPPEEEAERAAYRDEDGLLFVPSMAFRQSVWHAAGGRRVGKTSARAAVAGAVFPARERTRLRHPETGETVRDYRVHVARVVIRGQGILRARAEVPRWACELELEIDVELLQPVVVEDLLNLAGRVSGVGDWRPQKTGPHGRYRAELR